MERRVSRRETLQEGFIDANESILFIEVPKGNPGLESELTRIVRLWFFFDDSHS